MLERNKKVKLDKNVNLYRPYLTDKRLKVTYTLTEYVFELKVCRGQLLLSAKNPAAWSMFVKFYLDEPQALQNKILCTELFTYNVQQFRPQLD